ncbi:MAG: hypothetical protein ACI9DG_001399 [Oleispira sp.]|jgi:hypothetical protein
MEGKIMEWVKLPTGWIREGGLRVITWKAHRSGGIAALQILIALAHAGKRRDIPISSEADMEAVPISYTSLSDTINVSRTLISKGKLILRQLDLISVEGAKPEKYTLNYLYDDKWGKLPMNSLINKSYKIRAFDNFKQRKKIELNALKIYLLIIAFRNDKTNYASISYPRIEELSGVDRNDIRNATSLLCSENMINISRSPAETTYEIHNKYYLQGISNRHHLGTR